MTKQSSLQIFEEKKVRTVWDDKKGLFNIQTFEMFEGDLPTKAQELVREWLEQHSQELQKMWDNQKIDKLPPLL